MKILKLSAMKSAEIINKINKYWDMRSSKKLQIKSNETKLYKETFILIYKQWKIRMV